MSEQGPASGHSEEAKAKGTSGGSGEPIEARVERLEVQVARISRELGIYRLDAPAAEAAEMKPAPVAAPVAAPAAAVPAPGVPQAPNVPRATPKRLDAEGIFSGRILVAAGALILLLGIGFFIKYAFDNGWIGPTGRVAIGLIAGVAILLGGERLQRSKQTVFARAMTGLGGGILYLSLWGAGNGFHLVAPSVSFGAMVLVT